MVETDTMTSTIHPTFPIVGHPNSLCGYYKYNSLNNDSMVIYIVFLKMGQMLEALDLVLVFCLKLGRLLLSLLPILLLIVLRY